MNADMDSMESTKNQYMCQYSVLVVSLLHLMANDAVPHTICSTAVDLRSVTPSDYRNTRSKKKSIPFTCHKTNKANGLKPRAEKEIHTSDTTKRRTGRRRASQQIKSFHNTVSSHVSINLLNVQLEIATWKIPWSGFTDYLAKQYFANIEMKTRFWFFFVCLFFLQLKSRDVTPAGGRSQNHASGFGDPSPCLIGMTFAVTSLDVNTNCNGNPATDE